MIDADKLAREIGDKWQYVLMDDVRMAISQDIAAALRSYAAEIEGRASDAVSAARMAIATIHERAAERDQALAERDRLAKEVAGLKTSVALACDSANMAIEARDRSEDRARQSEAELVAMTAERDRLREALKPMTHVLDRVRAASEGGNRYTLVLVDHLREIANVVGFTQSDCLSSPTPEGGGG